MYLDDNSTTFGTIPWLLGAVLASSVLYFIGVAIYNLTFHPLAKYPGPKLWAAFWWPDTASFFTGHHVRDIYKLHQKYGPVVRINPNSLSYQDAKAWKDIYGFQPGRTQLQKDPHSFFVDKTEKIPKSIIAANDADHARYRRLLAHAFSDHALRGQETILNQYFNLLIQKLHEAIDGPQHGEVDMVAYYNWTTFDIIGDLAFGEPFGALEGGKYHPWISNVFRTIRFIRWFRAGARYPFLFEGQRALSKLIPTGRKARETHLAYTRERVGMRLDTETDRQDFLSYILRHNDEKGMTRQEIVANASTLIIAGSETTATLLSGATYHLLRNPHTLARLQAEVRGAFNSLDEITLLSSSKLPYLQAVLEESLRMYPPVADSTPRITPPQGAQIAGQWVSGGAQVSVHHWSTYRNPANFAEPEVFAPERFLPDVPARYAHDRKDALQPFSLGPRNCLGKNLAYNEMRSILARVIYEFDMELCPGSEGWTDQRTFVIWEKQPMMVRLSRRPQASS